MSRSSKLANLILVKQNMADKYVRLAKAANSVPARTRLHRKAESIRTQVTNLQRLAK